MLGLCIKKQRSFKTMETLGAQTEALPGHLHHLEKMLSLSYHFRTCKVVSLESEKRFKLQHIINTGGYPMVYHDVD